MRILILIPCYNEAAALPTLLEKLRSIPTEHSLHFAVINDCSTDDTGKIASQMADVAIHLPVNVGIGGAVQTGLLYAATYGYEAAIQVDGDGQHPPEQIPLLIQHWMNTKADVVVGSRFLDKKGFQSSALRRSGIRYLSTWLRLLTGKKILDVTSGFRLFGKTALQLAAHDYPDEYPEPECLIVFAHADLRIEEVPVQMIERQGGHSSIRYLTQLYYMAKVTLAMLFTHLKYRRYGSHPTSHHPR